jgi:rhomboid protease GluP
MICPQCGKLIGMGEERCPFCGAWQPAMFGVAPALQRLFGRHLDVVWVIVTTCIVLYVASLVLQPEAAFTMRGIFDILSPGTRALYQLGMTSGPVTQREQWWWTLLTANYLHGSLLHIFFNVMWIRQLGPAVDNAFGPARTFVLFSLSGAAGFALSNFASGAPTVGASASIFGLLAALIVYGRRTGESMLTRQLLQWAAILFVFGFVMPSVNNWAHLGGFAGGWVLAEAMRASHERREGRAIQIFALLLLLATLAGIALSFVSVTRMLLLR